MLRPGVFSSPFLCPLFPSRPGNDPPLPLRRTGTLPRSDPNPVRFRVSIFCKANSPRWSDPTFPNSDWYSQQGSQGRARTGGDGGHDHKRTVPGPVPGFLESHPSRLLTRDGVGLPQVLPGRGPAGGSSSGWATQRLAEDPFRVHAFGSGCGQGRGESAATVGFQAGLLLDISSFHRDRAASGRADHGPRPRPRLTWVRRVHRPDHRPRPGRHYLRGRIGPVRVGTASSRALYAPRVRTSHGTRRCCFNFWPHSQRPLFSAPLRPRGLSARVGAVGGGRRLLKPD